MTFQFRGKPIEARDGDTVASALYRAGQRIFSRSFKFHRPRGLLCLAGHCPNCLMNVDGAPNVRACVTPVREGMKVRPQNAWPSLEQDALAIAQRFDWLMPVGWYYKVFTDPKSWHAAEPFIRKVAGLGDPPSPEDTEGEYEHAFGQTDVAVVGGGPVGLEAAIRAAADGAQVTLIDNQPSLGGHLRYRPREGSPDTLIADLRKFPNVRIVNPAYCFGLYEGGLLGVLQPNPHPGAIERLIHLRAARIIVATGAYETPLLFRNNDLPGVMLSSAAERLIHLHGIVPGHRAAVVGRGERSGQIASVLREAGVEVVAILGPEAVESARGSNHVTGVRAQGRNLDCDLIVVCGHQVPDAGLITQAGGKLEWSSECGAFIPSQLPGHIEAVGEVTGAGLSAAAPLPPQALGAKRDFICLCSDVTTQDLCDGVSEGFEQIETLKRYTTATMGPCQGRMCQTLAIGVCSHATGRGMGETGTTTARPPNPSVTLGALSGPRHHPTRRTPMHYRHEALNAVWMDMGDWKRPRYYQASASSTERAIVEEEYRAVREAVGLIDVSTLGKLDVKGPDTSKLLDKVYAQNFSDLRPGRVRYSMMCDESGVMLDDGTVSRLSADRWFITTTTGNLEFVEQWLEWWLVGTGWQVYITNVTGGVAAVNLAGPKARDTLRKLTDCELETKAFPYMACREVEVAGAPATLLRIGFVGETGWEIHVPAESGEHVWNALIEAGAEFGIRPFGVEAQRLLRLEKRHVIVGVDTDALTNPFEAGMGWATKLEKPDFIGRRALERISSGEIGQKLVGFVMLTDDIPEDGAAVMIDAKLAGRVTSARYSPHHGRAVGLAWTPAASAREGSELAINIGGRRAPARVTEAAFYDPEGARLRQ